MKETRPSTLPLEECLKIPRFNYRNITKADQAELKAFAKRLLSEGQLTPIRIGVFTDTALKDQKVKELCGESNLLLIDGERRILAMSIPNGEQAFETISVEYITVESLKHYLSLQMTYNMDRRNTTFVEDGFGFKRFLESGGKRTDLLSCINFPPHIVSKKARLKYITERIDLLELHPDLYPFLNNGIIRAYKSKPHQGYLIKGFSELHQASLAKELTRNPTPRSDDAILGFFNKFRIEFSDPPFDPANTALGVEELGTGACNGCPHLQTVKEKGWNDVEEEITYCYLADCYQAKTKAQIDLLVTKLTKEKIPFVILGQPQKDWGNQPAKEVLENGLTKIRYYSMVEPGSCSHTIAGLADSDARQVSADVIHYVCPMSSRCVVHHPNREEERKEKRSSRLILERTKVEKATRVATSIEWAKLALETNLEPLKADLLWHYILCSFEYFYRSCDSQTQKTFLELIGKVDEKPFNAWDSKALQEAFEYYGVEKSWISLLFAHLIHGYQPPWDLFASWGETIGVDFSGKLEANLKAELGQLDNIHGKREENWKKETEVLQKKIHALHFDLPIFLGIHNWEDEASILSTIEDESIGKKACRLIGVKLGKSEEYVPKQIVLKLKGRREELNALFPKYSLPKKEADLVATVLKIDNTALVDLIPDTIKFGEGMLYVFLRGCIEKAHADVQKVALAEFLCADVKKTRFSVPVLHRSTVIVANKVMRAQSILGYCTLKEDRKTFLFKDL